MADAWVHAWPAPTGSSVEQSVGALRAMTGWPIVYAPAAHGISYAPPHTEPDPGAELTGIGPPDTRIFSGAARDAFASTRRHACFT